MGPAATKEARASGGPTALTPELEVGAGPGELSAEIRRIALGDPDVTCVFEGGADKCKELIEQKEHTLRPGSIIYIIRNFKHALKEAGREDLIQRAMRFDKTTKSSLGMRLLDIQTRNEIKKRGGIDRTFAYMHVAVYVGKDVDDGKYYVVENAGNEDGKKTGQVLLRTLEDSFDDNEFEAETSAFFIVKPPGTHGRTQQWALAAVGMPFKYNVKWVSCETFAQIVAGFFDDVKVNPMHQNRTLFKQESDVKPMMAQIKSLLQQSKSIKARKNLLDDDDDKPEAEEAATALDAASEAASETANYDPRLVDFITSLRAVFNDNWRQIESGEFVVSRGKKADKSNMLSEADGRKNESKTVRLSNS